MTTYTQSGTGATLTSSQISGGTFAPNTFFIESGTGTQLTQQQIAGSPTPTPTLNPLTPSTPAPLSTTSTQAPQLNYSIGQHAVLPLENPTPPPASYSATYTPPAAQAPTIADQFNTSLATTIQNQQTQLQQALQTQTKNFQDQIDSLKTQNEQAQQMETLGLGKLQDTVAQESAAKQAALDQEKQQFQQNYDSRQALVGQLQTLLTTGQSIVEGMKQTTGLASIMNPRISQTMADVQGQAGVISATLSAYDSQIGLAQNQLKSSLEAISSIYGDQTDYWKSVISFYDNQSKSDVSQIASLTKDQQTYINGQIQMLKDNLDNTQATTKLIQDAMLDPTKALAYAKAGVSLTDSPAQVSQKLALYEQSQQNVWSAPKLLGGDYIQTNKLTGETRTVVSNVTGASGSGGAAPAPGSAVLDGKLTTTADHITAAQQQLKASASQGAEADGKYADPSVYLKLFTDWLGAGGTEKGFLKYFPYGTYINPANTWLTDSMTQVAGGGGGGQTP